MTTSAEKALFSFLIVFSLIVVLFSPYECLVDSNKMQHNSKMSWCSCAPHADMNVPISSFIIKCKFRKHQGCRSPGPLTWPGTGVGSCWPWWAGCTDCWRSFLWSFVVFVWPRLGPICFFKTLTGTNCSQQYSSRGRKGTESLPPQESCISTECDSLVLHDRCVVHWSDLWFQCNIVSNVTKQGDSMLADKFHK